MAKILSIPGPQYKRRGIATGPARNPKAAPVGQQLAQPSFPFMNQFKSGQTITTPRAPSSQVTGGLQALVQQYNRAYGQARAANEARYQQMLSIAGQTTQQRAKDIGQAYAGQEAGAMQNLARLGMSGTTIAPTMRMGFEREKQSALDRLSDQMQATKLGIIERKEDKYPDLGALQSIIAGVGAQYGGGMGLVPMLQAFEKIRQ